MTDVLSDVLFTDEVLAFVGIGCVVVPISSIIFSIVPFWIVFIILSYYRLKYIEHVFDQQIDNTDCKKVIATKQLLMIVLVTITDFISRHYLKGNRSAPIWSPIILMVCYVLDKKNKWKDGGKTYIYTGEPISRSDKLKIKHIQMIKFSSTSSSSLSYTIPGGIFRDCNELESIDCPNDITHIDNEAFAYCSRLVASQFPLPLEAVGHRAFAGCTSLTNIDLSTSTLRVIEEGCFLHCSSLRRIEFPKTLQAIGREAFSFCTELSELINLHRTVLCGIGHNAFHQCHSLRRVQFPVSLLKIGKGAFTFCPELSELIDIEKSNLQDIGPSSFAQCYSLQRISLPSSLQIIGKRAFLNCQKLSRLKLPNDIREIGEHAFEYCEGLKSIQVPCPRLQTIQRNAFAYCKSLEYIQLPKSTRHLESSAFIGCISLRTIYLPDSIRTIGGQCFRDCVRLQSISLPTSMERLEPMAFLGCGQLTSVSLPACITTSMMMMTTMMTTMPVTDENVMQQPQQQQPRQSQMQKQQQQQQPRQPLEIVLAMSRKSTREGEKMTPILDTTAVRFFCDANRGGVLRYLVKEKGMNGYIDDVNSSNIVKNMKKKKISKKKPSSSYPPSLWPLIFHRINNVMAYDEEYINKLFDIYDGYSNRGDLRKSSIIYFFLIHGTVQDLCWKK